MYIELAVYGEATDSQFDVLLFTSHGGPGDAVHNHLRVVGRLDRDYHRRCWDP